MYKVVVWPFDYLDPLNMYQDEINSNYFVGNFILIIWILTWIVHWPKSNKENTKENWNRNVPNVSWH